MSTGFGYKSSVSKLLSVTSETAEVRSLREYLSLQERGRSTQDGSASGCGLQQRAYLGFDDVHR